VEYFNCLGSLITDDARRTSEIISRIAIAKAALDKKKALFTSTLELNLRTKPVKCCIWSIACFGAETWAPELRNTRKVLKCGAGERWRRSVGPIVCEMKYYIEPCGRAISYIQEKGGRLTELVTPCVGTAF
jgi:hypothetical protein